METYLIYIAKAAIAAGAFYIAFLLLFQNQKHFTFNRIYLPVSLALSFVIPLITFTTIKYIEPVTIPDSGSFAYLPATADIPQQPDFVFEWYHYLFGLYLLGVVGFLFHLLLGHLKAINIIKKSRIQKIFNNLVNITQKDVHPFSFFSKIVVSEKTLTHPELEMIVSHENIHVREKHTFDILFTEVLFLLQWFNPFAWLLKDAVKNNLEYLTDHEIAKHYNPQTYQLAMVTLADKQGIAPFLTALNGSQLKNRIVMMKKKTENKFAIVKQLAVLPLLAILVMGLANKEVKTEVIQPPVKAKITAVSVVEKETKVSGKVIDEKGKPLAGVAVLVKGTTTGTITDDKGNFKLLIDDKAETLIFSLNGFERVETPAGHGETQVIELELKAEKNAKPGEIVVVGYGTQKAESTSGGGYSISGGMNGTMQKGSENFTITPSSQNGLTIKSGGDPKNHPLFVVDGTEVKSIENLNPEEIEKIEVLKDKSATAVYGDKGKNGVILISTKKNDIPVQVKTTGKTKSGESLFYIVDEMPEYPGGDLALRTKIAHDIKYPVIAQENGIQGKVYVSFVVAKDGKVTEPVISRGVDPALDKEALRVVSNLEQWTPGKIDGEPVNVSYTIPITFALQGTSTGQSPAVSGQFNKQAIFELRRKIAQTIKYPVVAQENNQQGVVDVWAFVAKDGTISNISEKRLEGKIINIDEVVVTSLKSEKTVTSEKSKDLALLIKESKRVIEQLSPLKIPELAGETVSFRIKFVLE